MALPFYLPAEWIRCDRVGVRNDRKGEVSEAFVRRHFAILLFCSFSILQTTITTIFCLFLSRSSTTHHPQYYPFPPLQGWEEGSGLGRNQQGITTHVRVTKKFDTVGVGVAEAQKEAKNTWTVNTHVFDTILKNLNVVGPIGGWGRVGAGGMCSSVQSHVCEQ